MLAIPAYYGAAVERERLEHAPVEPDVEPSDTTVDARIMDARTGTEFLLRYSARRAERELGRLLDDPAYAARAQAVGHQVREKDGTARACEAIEDVLRATS